MDNANTQPAQPCNSGSCCCQSTEYEPQTIEETRQRKCLISRPFMIFLGIAVVGIVGILGYIYYLDSYTPETYVKKPLPSHPRQVQPPQNATATQPK